MSTCCNTITVIPGGRGAPGLPATDGIDGINAFTFTTLAFTMPAAGATVTVTVLDNRWVVPNGTPATGQILRVQNAGSFVANQLLGDTQIVLLNDSGFTGNAVAGTLIPAQSKVAPGGIAGPQGLSGSGSILSGHGDPNGIQTMSGSGMYYDLDEPKSIWLHDADPLHAQPNSVWSLKVQ